MITSSAFSVLPQHTLMLGFVKDNQDKHKRGRVTITLPKYSKKTEYLAYPISPSFGGGSGTEKTPSTDSWGWYAVPRVGDWVAVLALDGDLSSLFIIGGVPSKNQNMPDAKVDPTNIQFRSPNGHLFTFKMDPSDTSISLVSENGNSMLIDDVANQIKLTTVKGYSIAINDTTDDIIISKGGTTIKITASGDINLTTGGNVNITAGGTVNLN